MGLPVGLLLRVIGIVLGGVTLAACGTGEPPSVRSAGTAVVTSDPAGDRYTDLGRVQTTREARGGIIRIAEPSIEQQPAISAARAYESFLGSTVAARYPAMKEAQAEVAFGLLTVGDYGDLRPDGSILLRIEDQPAFIVRVDGVEVVEGGAAHRGPTATSTTLPSPIVVSSLIAVDPQTGKLIYQYVGSL